MGISFSQVHITEMDECREYCLTRDVWYGMTDRFLYGKRFRMCSYFLGFLTVLKGRMAMTLRVFRGCSQRRVLR